jgi:hypothetical protein
MIFTPGLIVVIAAMAFFYLRIAFLRGRKKRYEREFALKRRRVNGRLKGAVIPQQAKGASTYGIVSWYLIGIAFILTILGLLMYNQMTILGYDLIKNPELVSKYAQYWYVLVALGVVIFAFCFKVDKPYSDEQISD